MKYPQFGFRQVLVGLLALLTVQPVSSAVLVIALTADPSNSDCLDNWTYSSSYNLCLHPLPGGVISIRDPCKSIHEDSVSSMLGIQLWCTLIPVPDMPVPGMGGGGLPGK